MEAGSKVDVGELREGFAGEVFSPGDNGWDAARQAFNLVIDQRPVAVARPTSTDDVVAAIGFAREHGFRVAAQRTGHNAGPLGDLGDTLLVRTDELAGVEIDPGARRGAVQPGALWGDVIAPASESGLAPLAGSSPTVGVVGYSLGGGLGWLGRRHGLACNGVRSIELVNAEGELLSADAENEPDLFWALRGGGGNFGVVTRVEFDLYEVPELYAGMLAWPWEEGAGVLERWRAWTADAPDEATSAGRFLQVPDMPEAPDFIRGRKLALVEVAFLGREEEGARLIAPLRELGPELDTFSTVPPVALGALHMDPPQPVPAATGHALLGELPPAAIERLVEVAGPGSGSPLLSVELRHLGGALGRPAEGAGALDSIDGDFSLFGVGMAADAGMAGAVSEALAQVKDAFSTWGSGSQLSNFCERSVDPVPFFSTDVLARLCDVKRAYDPDGVFHANHPLPLG